MQKDFCNGIGQQRTHALQQSRGGFEIGCQACSSSSSALASFRSSVSNPSVRGRTRCRLHGGLSPGAPRGPKNGNFKTGDWTAEAIQERKWLRSLVQSFAKTGRTE
jgi:hypothetical protein